MHQPTLFISVPRLWAVYQENILAQVPQSILNILLPIPFIGCLLKQKIAKKLGLNKARVLGCGSAAVSPSLLKWYETIGLPITEAWGMTESHGLGTLNYPYRSDKVGTVGMPIPGIEIKLSPSGEILMKGKNLFCGYYKNEEATQSAFTTDGWLKTGDIGELDRDGYLLIKGRIKDNFKTSKGKFVSPAAIEQKIYERSRVSMACLIGSGLPAPILLVVPYPFANFDKVRYARSARKVLAFLNLELQSHEKIKGILMVKHPWDIEDGSMTPTLKIKRHVLEERYHELAEHWPTDKMIVWEDDLDSN